jgi:hypothetical protein
MGIKNNMMNSGLTDCFRDVSQLPDAARIRINGWKE